MKLSKCAFEKKYRVKSGSKNERIIERRLEYAEKFGYTEAADLMPDDYDDMEYLDAIECSLAEMAGRINDKMDEPEIIAALEAECDDETLDAIEEGLAYIMSLYDRFMFQLDFAEARLRRFYRTSNQYCVHKWAEYLTDRCSLYREKYGKGQKDLKVAITRKLKNIP